MNENWINRTEYEKYPLALKPGTVLACSHGEKLLCKYEILKVLGEGGFGVTYLARDSITGQEIAVKEYLPTDFATRTEGSTQLSCFSEEKAGYFEYGRKQFLEEAKTLSQFAGNMNIVRIYRYFEANNTAYFVMEFAKGSSLEDIVKKSGPITPARAEPIFRKLMAALDDVHSRGIVHRDIAPDNIIICANDEPKLIDFGAARYSTGEKSCSLDVILKHGFAPFEQYTRHGRQGPFTDVYALAATYYYALTGRIPPDSIDRLQNDTLILPSTLGIRLSVQAENALEKALNVQAQDRYGSMREFQAAMFGASTQSSGNMAQSVSIGAENAESFFQSWSGQNISSSVGVPQSGIIVPLLQRAFLFLEDGKWDKADEYCEKVLDMDPQNAQAYLGKLMTEMKVRTSEELKKLDNPLDSSEHYGKILRFGDPSLKKALAQINENIQRRKTYVDAKKLMTAATTEADYLKAAEKFKEISGFEDSDALAVLCRKKSEESQLKNHKEAERKAWEDHIAVETRARKKKLLPVFLVAAFLVAGFFFLFSSGSGKNHTSSSGIKVTAAPVSTARPTMGVTSAPKPKATTPMPVTKPAAAQQSATASALNEQDVTVGKYVTFGSYEQDNNTSNGKEPIEWLVLDKQDGKVLLLSRYGLDCQPYNTKSTSITWENCALRTWLNNDFLNSAFAAEEQRDIETAIVSADKNPSYHTDSGNTTKDKVFLLSITEVEKYFADKSSRMCIPTVYAEARGASTNSIYKIDDTATCVWWLRSSGLSQHDAAVINYSGTIFSNFVPYNGDCIRPSMWVSLDRNAAAGEEIPARTPVPNPQSTAVSDLNGQNVIIGEYLTFGTYEQDNNTSNGKEPIEWLVLDKQDGKALLISRYTLDCRQYNTKSIDVTWATSKLRTWLNNDFLSSAFSAEEQKQIAAINVTADKNPKYSTDSGKETNDSVFLLSIAEAQKYFEDNNARMCAPTAYAKAQGAYTNNDNRISGAATCWWWLRSPGSFRNFAAFVDTDGSLNTRGRSVNIMLECVRPALWVNLK